MIEHVLSPYPGKFCKLKKEAPALSASNRLSGKVLPFLCIRKAVKRTFAIRFRYLLMNAVALRPVSGSF